MVWLTLAVSCSQESYSAPDTDPRTGLPLDVGSSDLEGQSAGKKNGGFFKNGLLRAVETPHRGAGGIPEVKVVGNGHSHGKGVRKICAPLTTLTCIPHPASDGQL
jgi:hypothetical protein